MGGILFLWILLVVVAFVNHQYTLVGWVLGATFVLIVVGAMIHASSEEKAALERVKREKQDQDRVQPSPVVASPPEVHQTAGHRAATAGAMLLLGWCLIVAVAVGTHHVISTLWLVGVSIVVLAAAITMIGSGKKRAASANAPANTNSVRQEEQEGYQPSDRDRVYFAYKAARDNMQRRLRLLELKYPLDWSKEQRRARCSPIEAALRRAETSWGKKKKHYDPYAFFWSEANLNVLQMWVTDEDLKAFYADASEMYRLWEGWAWINGWLPQEKVEHKAPDGW